MNLRYIFVSFHLILIFCFNLFETHVVNTTSGSVKGMTINILNQTIEQYLGIPFAEPPVKSLRFAKPKPLSKPIEVCITCPVNKCIKFFWKKCYVIVSCLS